MSNCYETGLKICTSEKDCCTVIHHAVAQAGIFHYAGSNPQGGSLNLVYILSYHHPASTSS